MTELLTTKDVAALSGRHAETVLLAARRGLLHSLQAHAGCVRRYHLRDVDAWIDAGAPHRLTASRKASAARSSAPSSRAAGQTPVRRAS